AGGRRRPRRTPPAGSPRRSRRSGRRGSSRCRAGRCGRRPGRPAVAPTPWRRPPLPPSGRGPSRSPLLFGVAVETEADPLGDRPGPVAEPGRNDGGEAARRPAGRHHQQVVGRREGGELLVGIAPVGEGALAPLPPLAARHAGPPPDMLPHVGLPPAGG